MTLELAGFLLSALGSLAMAAPTLIMLPMRAGEARTKAASKAAGDPMDKASQLFSQRILRLASFERWSFSLGLGTFALGQVLLLVNYLGSGASLD
tara:strand:- start:186 stop:470 length:285 start_codon:yes stop_codon:yes gene_type:complete